MRIQTSYLAYKLRVCKVVKAEATAQHAPEAAGTSFGSPVRWIAKDGSKRPVRNTR